MTARPELAGGRLACVPEAPLEDSGAGLAPTGEGWFVVNVRDTKWAVTAEYGSGCGFESREFTAADIDAGAAQCQCDIAVSDAAQMGHHTVAMRFRLQ